MLYEYSRRRQPDEESAYYEEKLNHLWVDIFILDRLPDGAAASRATLLQQKALYALAMGHRRRVEMKKYTLPQKLSLIHIFRRKEERWNRIILRSSRSAIRS